MMQLCRPEKKIDGDYTNIIGLPLARVLNELRKLGVKA